MGRFFKYRTGFLFLLISIQLFLSPSRKVFAGGLSDEGENQLSVLTLNIYHDRDNWPERLPLILQEVRTLNPDIIALQEVIQRKDLENQAKVVADSLGYYYHFTSVDDESSPKRYGNAILSRYPIEKKHGKNLKPYDDFRTVGHVSVVVGGKMIDIYNTHLHHLEKNGEIRKKQIFGLLDFIDETSGKGPTFLMGDFNANPHWEELDMLKKKFRDVYPIFNEDHLDTIHSTLNYHLGHKKRRIDHIYFRRSINHQIIPLKAEIVLNQKGVKGLYPSDHFGVYAEFSIGEEAVEPAYTQVFFDNSLMEKSWFYSETNYSGESFVLNVNGKLPVAEQPVFTPGNSLKLAYKSAPEGEWKARLNFAKVRGQDHIKDGKFLSMRIFVKNPTFKSQLPEVGITLNNGASSRPVPISDYLENYRQGEWMHVQIPLSAFEKPDGQLLEWSHSKEIVSVLFQQDSADGQEHKLFLDQVELLPEKSTNILLFAPELKSARGFERHVDLKWESVNADAVRYVKIYRSEDGEDFQPVGIQSPMASNRYADFTEIPDKTYHYAISLLDIDYHETDLSEAVEVKTHSMSDSELLEMVQEAAFRYYWEGAEPNSGLARENIPGRKDMIATGASGFGLMALVVGAERGFISREELIERLDKITTFIEEGDRFHGALSHFMDGPSGKVEPFFGKYDDGGDLVETSFFMQGLLVARQYLSEDTPNEKALRERMSAIWEAVEWNWYKQYPDSPFLYWHWSPEHAWHINHKLIGWNETMITYFLGIASPSFGIDPSMYYSGWASQDNVARNYRANWGKTDEGSTYSNGNTYYGIHLDVGVSNGGPLFFTHYSFMGLDPHKMEDQYTNYFKNNQSIAKINYRYCCQNPGNYFGYGPQCWGLTASDGPWGYKAREPILRMDDGTIAPTGAIASFPHLPEASMEALKFFYRDCGHFLWGEYGFRDAFNLTEGWCANIYMGLNQAPMTVMIENYRTGLIWDLFMSAPEVQEGLEAIKKVK